MATSATPDLAELYRDTRERLTSLVAGLDDESAATPVPACPGWSIQNVMAHLTAVVEDVLDGRLTGPPNDEQTAAQVARFEGRELWDVLATWNELSPGFEPVISTFEVWPAVLDLASHEQDVRGALGMPGARDSAPITLGATRLISMMEPPIALRVVVEDEEFVRGPQGDPQLTLTTTRYETFRWRLGRRSRSQLAALDWSGDPSPVLDHLVIFGPAKADLRE